MMSYKVQQLTEPVVLGEGPHWDERQQALLFVSVLENTIHKYVLASGKHTKTTLDGGTSFIIPVEGKTDQYVVGPWRKILIIQWDGEEGSEVEVVRDLGEVDQGKPNTIFNDGKVDPRGRLFAGTLTAEVLTSLKDYRKEMGTLYRIDATTGDIKIDPLADKISLANGLAWDLNEKAFYYVDTMEFKIRRYDYDVETGNISNLTYVFDLIKNNISDGDEENLTSADGMTIDTDGNLWIAVFNSSSVIKIDPRTGKLLQTVHMPVKQVTSVTFGGPDLDVLFVTSASVSLDGSQQPPMGGATFMITGLGIKGQPNVNFRIK